jgi:hypothetical protein
MQNPKLILTLIAIFAIVMSITASGQEKECTYGVTISCIESFHEAMAPSCHKYMPAKDYETVRKHIPNMLLEAERIAEYKLDSTYASVSEDFEMKREAFLLTILDLKRAAESTDDTLLAKAFDKMHMAFAQMASVLALTPEEVDEFHELVGTVWHEYLPAKDYEAIKKTIPDLRKGVEKMKAAKLPEAKQGLTKDYLAAIGAVEISLTAIEEVIDSKSDEKISEAVTALHNGFMDVMALF